MCYTDLIRNYLTGYAPNYGDPDIHSLLEHLWRSYTDYDPINNEKIKNFFLSLEPIFEVLPPNDSDRLCDTVVSLCLEHERLAFLEGLRVGSQLMLESVLTQGSSQ